MNLIWHDLRKNPNDLPKVGMNIVYAFKGEYSDIKEGEAYLCSAVLLYDEDLITDMFIDKNGIEYVAWAEFEPFREGMQ